MYHKEIISQSTKNFIRVFILSKIYKERETGGGEKRKDITLHNVKTFNALTKNIKINS